MQEDMEADLCSDDPWLVLHKIDSPTKMRYVGSRVTECYSNKTIAPDHIAPSLAPYIIRDGRLPGSVSCFDDAYQPCCGCM